jgi:ankyrin repeat protein
MPIDEQPRGSLESALYDNKYEQEKQQFTLSGLSAVGQWLYILGMSASREGVTSLAAIGTRVEKRMRALERFDGVDDQVQRFQLWAINLGLTQHGHASLDYRFRDAPLIFNFALGLLTSLDEVLDLVEQSLGVALHENAGLEHVADQESEDSEDSSDSSEDELLASVVERDPLELGISRMSDIIDRLYRLSFKIRNPSNRLGFSKAKNYKQIDGDTGIDLIEEYSHHDFRHLQEEFKRTKKMSYEDSSTHYLVSRLARANVTRRQQFGHWSKHRSKLGAPRVAKTPGLQAAKLPAVFQEQETASQANLRTAAVTLTEKALSRPSTATRVPDERLDLDETASMVSTSTYAIDIAGTGQVEAQIPPLPRSARLKKELECPYCFILCSRRVTESKAWHHHVMKDLRPYQCLHEDCQTADQLYDSLKDWISHESECHGRSLQRQKCPFCDELPNNYHIASHLRKIALFSLPRSTGLEDDKGGAGSAATVYETRSVASDLSSWHDDIEENPQSTPKTSDLDAVLSGSRFARPTRFELLSHLEALGISQQLSLYENCLRLLDRVESPLTGPSDGNLNHELKQALDSMGTEYLTHQSIACYTAALRAWTTSDTLEDLARELRATTRQTREQLEIHLAHLQDILPSRPASPIHGADVPSRLRATNDKSETPTQKLARLSTIFRDILEPMVEDFLENVPLDERTREQQYAKVKETLNGQLVSKLVDIAPGPGRDSLLKEARNALERLDAASLGSSAQSKPSRQRLLRGIHEIMKRKRNQKSILALIAIDIYDRDLRLQTRAVERALELATSMGDSGLMCLLYRSGVDINMYLRSSSDGSPIYIASKKGHQDLVECLISLGADVHTLDEHGDQLYGTTLIAAIHSGNPRIVEMILAAEANPIPGIALTEAIQSGNSHIVELLLAAGADVNDTHEPYDCALSMAAFLGNMPIFKLLLDHGAEVNDRRKGPVLSDTSDTVPFVRSPLHVAARRGSIEMVECLIERGADIDYNHQRYGTALMAATIPGHEDVVNVLIKHGAHINVISEAAATALFLACDGHQSGIVEQLLASGAEINTTVKDPHSGLKSSALQAACQRGYSDIVQQLLAHGANANLEDAIQTTILNGHVEIMQLLLEYGADATTACGTDGNALDFARRCDDKAMIDLIEAWMRPTQKQVNSTSAPLRKKSKDPMMRRRSLPGKVEEFSSDESEDYQTIGVLEKGVDTGTMMPAEQSTLANRDLIIEGANNKGNKLKLNVPEFTGDSRQHQQRPSMKQLTVEDRLKISNAVVAEDADTAILVLQKYADPDVLMPTATETALEIALEQTDNLTVDMLFAHAANENQSTSAVEAKKFLDRAVRLGYTDTVKRLIDRGIDVNTTYNDSHPLYSASAAGHAAIAGMLLRAGADVECVVLEHGAPMTPLTIAAYHGHLEVTKVLLQHGADATRHDAEWGCALTSAAAEGHLGIAELLLDNGAPIDAVSSYAGTALQLAAFERRFDMVSFLLSRGADVNETGGKYWTPLQAACAWDQVEMVKLLLDYGANVDRVGGEYHTALLAAASKDCIDNVRLLLHNKADLRIRDFDGQDALVIAYTKRHYAIVDVLMTECREKFILVDTVVKIHCSRGEYDAAEQLCTAYDPPNDPRAKAEAWYVLVAEFLEQRRRALPRERRITVQRIERIVLDYMSLLRLGERWLPLLQDAVSTSEDADAQVLRNLCAIIEESVPTPMPYHEQDDEV